MKVRFYILLAFGLVCRGTYDYTELPTLDMCLVGFSQKGRHSVRKNQIYRYFLCSLPYQKTF